MRLSSRATLGSSPRRKKGGDRGREEAEGELGRTARTHLFSLPSTGVHQKTGRLPEGSFSRAPALLWVQMTQGPCQSPSGWAVMASSWWQAAAPQGCAAAPGHTAPSGGACPLARGFLPWCEPQGRSTDDGGR